jgi:hypothetical protein
MELSWNLFDLVIIQNIWYTDTIPKIISCSHSDHNNNYYYYQLWYFFAILTILAAILEIKTDKNISYHLFMISDL